MKPIVCPILRLSALSWQARVVGEFLWQHARDYSVDNCKAGDVWWSVPALVDVLGISRPQVFLAIAELERVGVLSHTGRWRKRVPIRRVHAVQSLDVETGLDVETVSNSRCDPVSNSRCDPVSNSRPGIEELNSRIELTLPRSAKSEQERESSYARNRTGTAAQASQDAPGASIAIQAGGGRGETPRETPERARAANGTSVPSRIRDGSPPTLIWAGAGAWFELLADELADAWPDSDRERRAAVLLERGMARGSRGRYAGHRFADVENEMGGWARLVVWGRKRLDEEWKNPRKQNHATPTTTPAPKRAPPAPLVYDDGPAPSILTMARGAA